MSNKRLFFISNAVLFTILATTSPLAFAQSDPNASVAAAVSSYFSDIPVMIAIAKCESGPRQFAIGGTPLYAGTGDRMVGIFQIDSSIHTAPALALGFDITTVIGNMGYARYLYGAEGTAPWISSFPCWSYAAASNTVGATDGATAVSPMASGTPILTLNLSLGWIDPQVLILQQLLNQIGYTLASSGPGSPGNETTKFGALTYAALKKFQCAQGIACTGDEATTGYGLLNAPTRAALLAEAANGAPLAAATTTAVVAVVPVPSTATPPTIASATVIIAIATTTITSPAPTSTITAQNPAEISDLQSRVAALVIIVQQLEAEIAKRLNS